MDWESLLHRTEEAFRQPNVIQQGTGRGATGQTVQIRLQSGQTIRATCLSPCNGSVVCFQDEQGQWYARGNVPITQREQVTQNRRRRDIPAAPSKIIFLILRNPRHFLIDSRSLAFVGGHENYRQVFELPPDREFSVKCPVIWLSNSQWFATFFTFPEEKIYANAFREQLVVISRDGMTRTLTDSRIFYIYPLGYGVFASGMRRPSIKLTIEERDELGEDEIGTGFISGYYSADEGYEASFEASGTFQDNSSRVIVFEHPVRNGQSARDTDFYLQIDIEISWQEKSFWLDLATDTFLESVWTTTYSETEISSHSIRAAWDDVRERYVSSMIRTRSSVQITRRSAGAIYLLENYTIPCFWNYDMEYDRISGSFFERASVNYSESILIDKTKSRVIYYKTNFVRITTRLNGGANIETSTEGEEGVFLLDSTTNQTISFFQQTPFSLLSYSRPTITNGAQIQLIVLIDIPPRGGISGLIGYATWYFPPYFSPSLSYEKNLQPNTPYPAIARWRDGWSWKEADCLVAFSEESFEEAGYLSYTFNSQITLTITSEVRASGYDPRIPQDGMVIESNSGSIYDFLHQIGSAGYYGFVIRHTPFSFYRHPYIMPTWEDNTILIPRLPPNRPNEDGAKNSFEKWKIEIEDSVARMRRAGWINVSTRRIVNLPNRSLYRFAATYLGRTHVD